MWTKSIVIYFGNTHLDYHLLTHPARPSRSRRQRGVYATLVCVPVKCKVSLKFLLFLQAVKCNACRWEDA